MSYKNKKVNYAVNSIFDKLELAKTKTFHSLRHTFISNAKSQSDEIEVVRLPKSLANAIRSKGAMASQSWMS